MRKDISLADFARFVRSPVRSRRTIVRNSVYKPEYSVVQDFYKRVREKLKTLHKNGGDLTPLSEVPEKVNEKRRPHIQAAVSGFIGWATSKSPTFIKPLSGTRVLGDVSIPVTPEVAVVIKGTPFMLKVNYTATPTSAEDASVIAQVMHEALGAAAPKSCRMGVLDIRTGKVQSTARSSTDVAETIRTSARLVSALWDEVEAERV